MILALDVGNTNIVAGVIENGDILDTVRLATDAKKTSYEYAVELKLLLGFKGRNPDDFEGTVISCVVSPLTNVLNDAAKMLFRREALIVGKGIKTGLDIRIDDPGQIGADLVVGSVATKAAYPVPAIMIDMGTATTVCALDAEGRFIGGAIAPGLNLSMQALAEKTSQLPHVALDPPEKCIGTNTITCMQSGAIYGTASMLDGLIDRMEQEIGSVATIVATGGLAGRVAHVCRREIIVDDDLLLKGLWIIWTKNIK